MVACGPQHTRESSPIHRTHTWVNPCVGVVDGGMVSSAIMPRGGRVHTTITIVIVTRKLMHSKLYHKEQARWKALGFSDKYANRRAGKYAVAQCDKLGL